jgi:hypothetical protein
MSVDSMVDPDLGQLAWDESLERWEGSIALSSPAPYRLYVFARASYTRARTITRDARLSLARLRTLESACRRFATDQLFDVHNSEWSTDGPIRPDDFASRLAPDGIEVHETGSVEIHFRDGGLFSGHGIGVRLSADGTLLEAVVEG